ncbi:Protein cwh43, partial [Coemansia sp. RSA 25]
MWTMSRQTRHFLADTYLSFVFWTVLTSLGLCIWYFPLWHMGISGYEVALFADMAPVLLGIPGLRRLLQRHRWISAALSLVGIVAYATPSPARRLLGVVVGTAGALLGLGAALRPDGIGEAGRLARDIQAWEAGLLASVAVRMVFQTNNPVWATMNEANGGWNKTGIALGLLALADVATRRSDKTIATKRSDKPREAQVLAPAWMPVGLGLGALLFALHSLYSDSAIVGRWSWDGYPATGPAPVPWGGLVLTALAGGFAGGHRLELATGMLWWAAGSAGACAITLVPGWSGFAGGLVLAVYVASVTRSILLAAARCPPGRTLGAALLWYNVL